MTAAQEIEKLYADYLERFRAQDSERGPGQGILGMGVGPGDLPCHGQLLEELKALLSDIAGRGLPSGEVREALEVIFRDPARLKAGANAAYWTLLAAQGLSLELIGLLGRDDAAALYARYNRDYPRFGRLPAQKKVIAALGERAE